MQLTSEELREIIARAEEIQKGAVTTAARDAEFIAVINAAEEVGISRYAIERALRERFALPAKSIEVGDRVFAKSSDGRFYVAEVTETEAGGFQVEFYRGGEHSVSADEVRPFRILPGDKLTVDWPWWGKYTGTVVRYEDKHELVTLSDGMSEESFELDKVWLEPPKTRDAERRVRIFTYGWIAVAGAAIGAAVTAFLLR
jgi:hypothetical protein